MDFKDQIKKFGERVGKNKRQLCTEEATKNTLIMPVINTLDVVFNSLWRIPEFIANNCIKKGEKVD